MSPKLIHSKKDYHVVEEECLEPKDHRYIPMLHDLPIVFLI